MCSPGRCWGPRGLARRGYKPSLCHIANSSLLCQGEQLVTGEGGGTNTDGGKKKEIRHPRCHKSPFPRSSPPALRTTSCHFIRSFWSFLRLPASCWKPACRLCSQNAALRARVCVEESYPAGPEPLGPIRDRKYFMRYDRRATNTPKPQAINRFQWICALW